MGKEYRAMLKEHIVILNHIMPSVWNDECCKHWTDYYIISIFSKEGIITNCFAQCLKY